MTYFVLIYDDDVYKGEYVAQDEQSGGYPIAVSRLDQAYIWPECFYQQMIDYIDMFPQFKWKITEVKVIYNDWL